MQQAFGHILKDSRTIPILELPGTDVPPEKREETTIKPVTMVLVCLFSHLVLVRIALQIFLVQEASKSIAQLIYHFSDPLLHLLQG